MPGLRLSRRPTGALETCETGGILNSAVNLIASAAVTEAMKFLVGAHDQMRRTLLSFDAWYNDRSEVRTGQPRADCTVCGQRQFAYLSGRAHAHLALRTQLRADTRAPTPSGLR